MKRNPFKSLSRFEFILWISSLSAIIITFFIGGSGDLTSLTASLIGATALIFVAKGQPLGQLLTVVFALFYGFISFKFRYWGEMITYIGMTSPIALAAFIAWLKNPFEAGRSEVKVASLSFSAKILLTVLTAAVTVIFYFILRAFDTPNLFFSSVSVTTSFLAASLTLLRSPYYALAYAANDIILINLWILACTEDISYLPVVVCFFIFLINDTYGFINWQRMKRHQSAKSEK